MGCNCKRRTQVLNYEDSKDHINLIESTFKDIFPDGMIEDLSDLDKVQLVSLYKSIYPNSKGEPQPLDVVNILQGVVEKYYSRKR